MNKALKKIVIMNLIISIIMILICVGTIIGSIATIHSLQNKETAEDAGEALGMVFAIIIIIIVMILFIGIASIALIPAISMFISSLVILKSGGGDIKKLKRQRNGLIFNNVIMFLLGIGAIILALSQIPRNIPASIILFLVAAALITIAVIQSKNIKAFNAYIKTLDVSQDDESKEEVSKYVA